ncbi:MAG: hypothetical protein RLY31_1523 [Bacteroidota bacterium]
MAKKGMLVVSAFLPVIVCAATIGVLSLNKSAPVPQEWVPKDKVNHMLAYAGLAWLAFRALSVIQQTKRNHFLITFVAVVAYGMLMEFLQGLLPYRRFEWLDMAANLAGVILAYLGFRFFTHKI